MTIQAQYAKALSALVAQDPQKGEKFLGNLKAALKRRGHEKLLPHIFAEYEKLDEGRTRAAAARKITPERERTRVLFELYKKLIA